MRTLVWQGLDAPRMEAAHVEVDDGRLRARGTQIGGDYELRYEVAEPRLLIEIVGGSSLELELDEGRDHFDLGYSPLFNSLPVLRHGLHTGGAARSFVMTWVSVPDLAVSRSEQRYDPLGGNGVVRFASGTFTADIEFDEQGFVSHYPGLASLVNAAGSRLF
jgi:hypothetical protein